MLPDEVLEATVNNLPEVSQPNPAVSEVILLGPLKNAIWPLVPDPATPPDPTVQVTMWFDPSRQRAEPVLDDRPRRLIVVEPAVPKLIVLPVTPVPILIVFAEAPVPRLTVPVPVESRVKAPAPLLFRVNPVFNVEAEITGFAPENVNAVEVKVSPLYVPAVMLPPVSTFNPPNEEIDSVPEAFPITLFPVPVPTFVVPLPVLFKFTVPVIVAPPVPCIRPDCELTPTEVNEDPRVSAPADVTTKFAPFI